MGSKTTETIKTFINNINIINFGPKERKLENVKYPAGDAHGLNLRRFTAEFIQLMFTEQEFLRYLIIVGCWKTHNTAI